MKLTGTINFGLYSLFLTNSFTVGIDFEFQYKLLLLFQSKLKDKVHERMVGSSTICPHIDHAIYFVTHSEF